MNKRIFRYMAILTAVVLTLTVTFMAVILMVRLPSHLSDELGQLRVAIIQDDGKVPFDNWVDPSVLPEMRGRSDVDQAFNTGLGTAKRYSPTLHEEVYYVSIRITAHEVLKLAFTEADVATLMIGFMQDFLFCLLMAIVVTLFVTRFLTQRLVSPFLNVSHPEEVAEIYPEIRPYVEKIQDLEQNLMKTAQYRTEFSANVSHELKTPVTQIMSAAQAIEIGMNSGRMAPEQVSEWANDIVKSSKHLSEMITQILALSKFDEQSLLLETKPLDIVAEAKEIIENTKRMMQREDVEIVPKGAAEKDEPVMKDVDQVLFDVVMKNLIENAIKYSKPNQPITVLIDEREFSVTNFGEVIAPEQIDKLFERFFRTDKARTGAASGYGLGLAFVHNIVMAHGFDIRVTSDSEHGTKFTVFY